MSIWNYKPQVGEWVEVSFVHEDRTVIVKVEEVGADYFDFDGYGRAGLDNIDGIRKL